ncbi:hypothetical protein Patl1_02399 [Pistacia atlantica]|uniref:Uncharacterized protein n=1 Tax=Pistacia atlantica TaxID=434234 RepID=A0ACC1CAK1_9ROSI|nr:hypothetical protein Patl1_02399 [Pistacia atlantica]
MNLYGDFLKHHNRLLLLLKSCSKTPSLRNTKPLHALVITLGPNSSQTTFVFNNVISIYSSVGELSSARKVFDKMPEKNVVSFNTIISSYSRCGYVGEAWRLFYDMRNCGCRSTQFTLGGLLSCDLLDLCKGVQLHALIVKNGLFIADAFVGTALLGLYGRHESLHEAVCAFEDMPKKSIVTWNSIISIFGRYGFVEDCIFFFRDLVREKIPLSEGSFVGVLSGFICEQYLIAVCGKSIHAKIIKTGLECDAFVGSALVDFYVKCDNLEDAQLSFDEISDKNVVSWNSLILGYANKYSSTSMFLLIDMLQLGYQPNEFTFSHVLKSSFTFELSQLHCLIIRMGYQSNEYVLSSLMSSYAKNGLISDAIAFATLSNSPIAVVPSNIIAGIYNRLGQYHEALKLFSLLEEPDIVSWNTAIAACAHNGYYTEVFELFKYMQLADIHPDNCTFVSLLSACTKLCNLTLGCSLHALIIKADINRCDTFLFNVLIDMYGKCGSIGSSIEIFKMMTDRNIITWTTLISALGLNGFAYQALEKFREMEILGFKPDRVAVLAVLTACRHGGLVTEGMELFGRMKRTYGVEPEMDHYHCLVNLLATYGHLKEAEKIIATMPFPPNALIWRSFLGGCRRQKTVEYEAVG